jgi:hypothetical protein
VVLLRALSACVVPHPMYWYVHIMLACNALTTHICPRARGALAWQEHYGSRLRRARGLLTKMSKNSEGELCMPAGGVTVSLVMGSVHCWGLAGAQAGANVTNARWC